MIDPAFPTENSTHNFHGISRREYFAAKAMQALLARDVTCGASDKVRVSDLAFKFADAMIAESDKLNTSN